MSSAIEGASVNINTASQSFTQAGADPAAAAKFTSLLKGADAQAGSNDGIVTSSELKGYEKSLTMALKDDGKLASELRTMFDKIAQTETKKPADTKSSEQPADTSKAGDPSKPAADKPAAAASGQLDVSDPKAFVKTLMDNKIFTNEEEAQKTAAIFNAASGDGQLTRSELEGYFQNILTSAKDAGPEQRQGLMQSIKAQLDLFDHLTNAQAPAATSAGDSTAPATDSPAAANSPAADSAGTLSLKGEAQQTAVAQKLIAATGTDVNTQKGYKAIMDTMAIFVKAAGPDGVLERPELENFLQQLGPEVASKTGMTLKIFDTITQGTAPGPAPTGQPEASPQTTAPGPTPSGQPEASQAPAGSPQTTIPPADPSIEIKVGDGKELLNALTRILPQNEQGAAVATQTAADFVEAAGQEGALTRPKLEAFMNQKVQQIPDLNATQKGQLVQQTVTIFDLLVLSQMQAQADNAPASNPGTAPDSAPAGQPATTPATESQFQQSPPIDPSGATTSGGDSSSLQDSLKLNEQPSQGTPPGALW